MDISTIIFGAIAGTFVAELLCFNAKTRREIESLPHASLLSRRGMWPTGGGRVGY